MTIIPLSEGSFTIDKTKHFLPFNAATDNIQDRAVGSLLVEVQPFCIVTNNDVIVIDTGLGFSVNGQLQIHANLIAKGIQPHDVTKVLMSHLHKDHAGGVGFIDAHGNSHLSFPKATYYIQKQELAFSLQTGFPSFITEDIDILQYHPQVHWLTGNGIIDNYIKHEVTSAHSPFHQVFWIEENKEILFFGGDDAPQLQQMKNKFIAKYDFDGKKCMQLRQQWWEQGNKEGWKFLFYHDIKTPTYQPLVD